MKDVPHARLADLLRGREGDLGPLTCKILDASLDEEHAPADLQMAALAAAASLIVMLTPPAKLRQRARDAEALLKRLIHAHGRRLAEMGIDIAKAQREHNGDVLDAFGECWREVVGKQPIAERWLVAGVESPDHLRKVLMANALQEGMAELFSRVFGEQAVDRIGCMLATIDACAVVAAAPFDVDKPGTAEDFADLMVQEFRATLLRTIAYWREKKGH